MVLVAEAVDVDVTTPVTSSVPATSLVAVVVPVRSSDVVFV